MTRQNFYRKEVALSTEFAAIDAFIHYKIPFEQWRIYRVGEAEAEILNQLGLRDTYEKAMNGLARVLYQARVSLRPGLPALDPMFLLLPQSTEAILGDKFTDNAIWRSVLGEEKAARHIQNIEKLEKLRQRTSPPNNGIGEPNSTGSL